MWNGQHIILQNGSKLQLEGSEGSLDSWLQQSLPSHPVEGILFSTSQEDSPILKPSQSQIRIHHPEHLKFFAVDYPPTDNEQILGYEDRINKLLAIQTPPDVPLPSLLQLPQPQECESMDQFSRLQADSDKRLWLFRPRAIYLQRSSTSFQVQVHFIFFLPNSRSLPTQILLLSIQQATQQKPTNVLTLPM